MKSFFTTLFLIAALSLTGCYTQFQTVNREREYQNPSSFEEYYYTENDSTATADVNINNYYYDDPYGWDYSLGLGFWGFPTPRWGLYVGLSMWDPYWGYPGWMYAGYPFVTYRPWNYYGYYGGYWDPWYYGYGWGYGHHPRYADDNFKKRDFDRRSRMPNQRRIVRGPSGDGGPSLQKGETPQRRIIRRGSSLTEDRTASSANRRNIRSSQQPRRILRSDDNDNGRSSLRRPSGNSNSGNKSTIRRGSSRKSGSSSGSYTPRRSSGSSSSGSRSTVRGSSGRSSSGSSSSGSSSRSSGSTRRSGKRR
ncbi:MAG: hypothetical protein WAN36_09265 [Calditrichia bacterium]